MNTTSAILTALAWRILIAFSTRTFFQPDEFFQSLEIAHRAVFGFGHLTWEWTTSPPIRSVFFPSLYIPVYWLLKVTGLDKGKLLIIAPKILQGAIASITDISTRELARQLLGDRYVDTAYFLSLTSFFHILALSRTLSNSVETSLTTAALCFWPWHSLDDHRRLRLAFALAAISCLVRPTSAVLWAFLAVELCLRSRSNKKCLEVLFFSGIVTALIAAGFLIIIDSLYFGRVTFTPLNFVRTNLSSVSLFYGQAPWHYYLTQGLPILLNVCLLSFVFGSYDIFNRGLRHQRTLLALIIWTIFIYSLLGHKEWRFLHPILPVMIILSAKSLVDSSITSKVARNDTGQSKPLSSSVKSKSVPISLKTKAICALGILPGLYVMWFHGRAQISVMSYLRSLDPSNLHSVGFLMPCHSTPWQAYLHRPEFEEGLLWALSCEPPLHGVNTSTYWDQSDIFYASPLTYLKQNFPSFVNPSFPPSPYPSTSPGALPSENNKWDHRWPSRLVFFSALIEDEGEGREVEGYLRELGYDEVWNARNGFEEDWRRRGGVKVWQWQAGKRAS
ncbi:GPI10 [Sanghuangporus weigelae]